MRYDYTRLQEFRKENDIELLKDYSQDSINIFSFIEGKCLNTNCFNTFNKSFRSLVKTNGYCWHCSTKTGFIKQKQTMIEKYGEENPLKVEKIKNKMKNTCLEKYGTEYASQSQEFKDKIKNTCLEKYGTEYASQSQEFKDKMRQNCLEKHGVEHHLMREDVKNKRKETNLEKFGVEYVSQCPEIMDKINNSSYSKKDFIMPSGNIIKCQGYEPFALTELLEIYLIKEEDIITGCKNVPKIWYEDENNKKHRHYVDIFIPSENKCIEVKSTWTLEKKQECIFLKQEAGKELGYEYEIWVYNNKGEKVECYT